MPVPGEEARVVVLEKRAPLLFAPSCLPDAPDGDGVNRRLAQAAGVRHRGIGRYRVAVPALRPGKVASGRSIGIKDDVRYLAGGPLGIEKSPQLAGGAASVEMSQPDGDERAVPAPLVGIEMRSGLGPGAEVIAAQDLGRSPRDVGELLSSRCVDRSNHRTPTGSIVDCS